MRELDEETPRTMTMFCEEYHQHETHPWSEVGTVTCLGYNAEEAEKSDK